MYVYDVNGDGQPDIITCLKPDRFGLAWFGSPQMQPGGFADILNPSQHHCLIGSGMTCCDLSKTAEEVAAADLADFIGRKACFSISPVTV